MAGVWDILKNVGGALLGGVGQGLTARATQNKTGFDPRDASARMTFFNQNAQPGLDEQANAWFTRQGNLESAGQGLLNYYLSDLASGSGGLPNFSMLDRAGRDLLNRSGEVYDPFRQAVGTGREMVGTAQGYMNQAANYGLPAQQMQRRQLDEQLARMKGTPGLGPAQGAQLKNKLVQQNNMSAAASRENAYSDAVKQYLASKYSEAGLLGNLGQAYLSGTGAAGGLGAQRAGIEESALNRQQAAKTIPLTALGMLGNISLQQNPWTVSKMNTINQMATGQPLTQPQTNWGQLAAGAGMDALSTYLKQRQAGGGTPQWGVLQPNPDVETRRG